MKSEKEIKKVKVFATGIRTKRFLIGLTRKQLKQLAIDIIEILK